MAIRELVNNGGVYNYPAPSSTEANSLEPGMAVATTTAGLVRADRVTHDGITGGAFVGLLADYVNYNLDSTFINHDPVGSTYRDDSIDEIVSYVNAPYSGRRRQAFSWNQAEQLNNTINLTDVSGKGRRGVAVYQAPGQFIVDSKAYALKATSSTSADATTITTFAVGEKLTIGTGSNAGKLIKLGAVAHGPAVARVEAWDGALLTISTTRE